jgi:uncharacterized OB-fold protein
MEAPGVMFQKFLQAGEIRLQQCDGCRRQIFFPRTLCPHCGHGGLTWTAISGRGVVYSTTVVRQRPDKGGDYNVAIVELAEGARMLSRVQGIAPAEVAIGLNVEALIGATESGPLILFKPAGSV